MKGRGIDSYGRATAGRSRCRLLKLIVERLRRKRLRRLL